MSNMVLNCFEKNAFRFSHLAWGFLITYIEVAHDFYLRSIRAIFALKTNQNIKYTSCQKMSKKCNFRILMVFFEIETKNIHFIKTLYQTKFLDLIGAKNCIFSRFLRILHGLVKKLNF